MKIRKWGFSLVGVVGLSAFIAHSPVWAGDEGGDIVFKDTKSFAPVTFSHQKHKGAGGKCSDCHDQIFQKKKGSTDVDNALTMKVMKKGKYCGSCHDGGKAFSVKKNCKQCHRK